MDDVVCLFHEDCFDGLGAAWAVFKRYPNGRFIPVDYKNPPPAGLEGKHVVIVDFSYNLPEMREIIAKAAYVTFLDHHARSEEICADLSGSGYTNLHCQYEAHESGATMAWAHFHPQRRCPKILQHIADRDLWRWAMDGTYEIMQGLGVYPLELRAWDEVLSAVNHDDTRQEYDFLFHLEQAGDIIRRKNQTDIERIIRQTLRFVDFHGFERIPLINVPRSLGSEALAQLANDHDFAMGYYDDVDGRVFSLRSRKDTGLSVKTIAEAFGGGGHVHAAGFSVPRDHFAAQM